MEQILGVIKNEKISAGVMVLLFAFAWWAHAWAEGEFVKKSGRAKEIYPLLETALAARRYET